MEIHFIWICVNPALPYRIIWEKEILRKEFTNDKISLIRWPPWDFSQPPNLRNLITDLESPSRTKLVKLVSREKHVAFLATSNSKASTMVGFWIFSKSAAITSPLEFQMTTPMPASSDSPNIAPSKLTFINHLQEGIAFSGYCNRNWEVLLSSFESIRDSLGQTQQFYLAAKMLPGGETCFSGTKLTTQ